MNKRSFTTEQLELWVKRIEARLSLPIWKLDDAEIAQLDNAKENCRLAKATIARRKKRDEAKRNAANQEDEG